MPRVRKCAAFLFALLLASSSIATVATLTITSSKRAVHVGGHAPVAVNLPGSTNYTVYLFAGTADGTSVVTVGDNSVIIPVAGSIFDAGIAQLEGRVVIDAMIPDDDSLIGSTVTWVAVVVDNVTGAVIAIARTGGPIIEDAIC